MTPVFPILDVNFASFENVLGLTEKFVKCQLENFNYLSCILFLNMLFSKCFMLMAKHLAEGMFVERCYLRANYRVDYIFLYSKCT